MHCIRRAVDKRLNDIKFVGHAAATVASTSCKPRRYIWGLVRDYSRPPLLNAAVGRATSLGTVCLELTLQREARDMSRRSTRSQLDELKKEKERLETENARLQENDAAMQAELGRVREENRQLQEEKETDEGAACERREMETLLEEQRQMYEDLQAELGEAVERSTSLEGRCCSLENQLVKTMEESELERLRAVDEIRSKYEETFLWQVRELQKQVQALQSAGKAHGNTDRERLLSKGTTEPGDSDLSRGKSATDKPNGNKPEVDPKGDSCGETTKEATNKQSDALSMALMAQQLPLPSKFSGNDLSSDETFEEWITHFEHVAEVHKWSSQARLIHLITRLRGEAFSFYHSCSKAQKASYELLVKELTRCFTPVRIQSVQTTLFHDRKQRGNKFVDKYAQDLKSLFHKAYPQSQQGNEVAASMGKSVLASQFVAGLIPVLKPKVAGTEGGFEELLVKARFEEAKLRDLGPSKKPSEPSATPVRPAASPRPSQPTSERRPLLECTRCGGTNHTARYCRYRGRAEPSEARGAGKGNSRDGSVRVEPTEARGAGRGNSRDGRVRALVPPRQGQQRRAELNQALSDIVTTMHTITSQEDKSGVELGPTLTSKVQLEGCPVDALLDTGSPASIVSLEFLLEALAKQKKPEESPQQWRARVEKRLQEPPGALLRGFGGETLDLVCQVAVNLVRGDNDITAKVQVQKGAPIKFLLGK